MPYDLAIFDCDGVLVDSEPIANRILTEELDALGLDVDLAWVCREFIGLSMSSVVERVERRLGRPVPEGFLDEVQARTFAALEAELRPVPGVVEVLDGLALPVCVASSGEPTKMRLTLGVTGLLPRFDGRLFSATQVRHGKPAPDLFLLAARTMEVEPSRCVVIEDSLPGVRAARRAGMTVLGFAARGQHRELAGAGATVFFEMRELPRLLAGPDPAPPQ
jgi:HAD superfamily hydrolase (TIGR01509 family)